MFPGGKICGDVVEDIDPEIVRITRGRYQRKWQDQVHVSINIDMSAYDAAIQNAKDDLDFARAKPADCVIIEPLLLEDKQCES